MFAGPNNPLVLELLTEDLLHSLVILVPLLLACVISYRLTGKTSRSGRLAVVIGFGLVTLGIALAVCSDLTALGLTSEDHSSWLHLLIAAVVAFGVLAITVGLAYRWRVCSRQRSRCP
jgi:hypothetical protein